MMRWTRILVRWVKKSAYERLGGRALYTLGPEAQDVCTEPRYRWPGMKETEIYCEITAVGGRKFMGRNDFLYTCRSSRLGQDLIEPPIAQKYLQQTKFQIETCLRGDIARPMHASSDTFYIYKDEHIKLDGEPFPFEIEAGYSDITEAFTFQIRGVDGPFEITRSVDDLNADAFGVTKEVNYLTDQIDRLERRFISDLSAPGG